MSRTTMANQPPVGGSSSNSARQQQRQTSGPGPMRQQGDEHPDAVSRNPSRYRGSTFFGGGAGLGPDPKPQNSRLQKRETAS